MALAAAAGVTAGVLFLADRLDSRTRAANPASAAVTAVHDAAAPSSPEPPPVAAPPLAEATGRVEPASKPTA